MYEIKTMLKFAFIFFYLLLAPQIALAFKLDNQVSGVSKPMLTNVLARLNLQQQTNTPLTAELAQQYFEEAPQQIQDALQPFGYFKARIKRSLIKLTSEHWQAIYVIEPGPQLPITKFDFKISGEGAEQPIFQQLQANPPLKIGAPLLTADYNQLKKTLFSAAEELGYLDAKLLAHEIKVNLEQYTAAVSVHFATGQRYYFGKVHFQKNPLSKQFLQRFMPFKEGQPYSNDAILILQRDLNSSNYFKQALVQPNKQAAENFQVPIDVALVPQKSQQYSFGVGYGTDTGPRASLGWDWRYLTDTGHHLSTILRLSQVQNTLQSVYVIPGEHPLTDQYNVNASILTNLLPRGNNIIGKIGIAKINSLYHWQQTLALSYQDEDYRFNPQTKYINSKLLIPSITWERTVTDNPLYPLQGYRVSLKIQGASQAAMSDTSLVQGYLEAKYIKKIASQNRLLLRTNLGYTTVNSGNQGLPLSMSFFAGGSRSVRGYSYQALGPGRYLLVGSIEYQHQIKKDWNAAVFFDIGNAYQNLPASNLLNSLQQGAGIGLVWISPVGPINLSVAKAINWPGQPMQIQFSMGPDL